MPLPWMDRDHLAGNHFTMRCEYADGMLGPFRSGSLRVARVARVRAGDILEKVGNSGLGGRFLLRNDLVVVP